MKRQGPCLQGTHTLLKDRYLRDDNHQCGRDVKIVSSPGKGTVPLKGSSGTRSGGYQSLTECF